jgi:6-phosphogluconolactonase (cycloisomerase 2 family)
LAISEPLTRAAIRSITVDPSGRFAFVANFGSDNVSVFAVNTATGALSAAGTFAAGDGPTAVVVAGIPQ